MYHACMQPTDSAENRANHVHWITDGDTDSTTASSLVYLQTVLEIAERRRLGKHRKLVSDSFRDS